MINFRKVSLIILQDVNKRYSTTFDSPVRSMFRIGRTIPSLRPIGPCPNFVVTRLCQITFNNGRPCNRVMVIHGRVRGYSYTDRSPKVDEVHGSAVGLSYESWFALNRHVEGLARSHRFIRQDKPDVDYGRYQFSRQTKCKHGSADRKRFPPDEQGMHQAFEPLNHDQVDQV